MTVFDLMGEVRGDPRAGALVVSLAELGREFPEMRPGTYTGAPGKELDVVATELAAINMAQIEIERIRGDLPTPRPPASISCSSRRRRP